MCFLMCGLAAPFPNFPSRDRAYVGELRVSSSTLARVAVVTSHGERLWTRPGICIGFLGLAVLGIRSSDIIM